MIEIEKITDDIGRSIEESLQQLNATLGQVDIQVLQYGLFKKTKLRIKLNEKEQSLRDARRQQLLHKPIISTAAVAQPKDIAIVTPTHTNINLDNNQLSKITAPQSPQPNSVPNNIKLRSNKAQSEQSVTPKVAKPKIDPTYSKQHDKPLNQLVAQSNQQDKHPRQQLETKSNLRVNKHSKAKIQLDKTNLANHARSTLELSQDQIQSILYKFVPDLSKLQLLPTHPVVEFLSNLLQLIPIVASSVQCYDNNKNLHVVIDSEDLTLVAHRGEILNSLETVAHTFVNRDQQHNIRLTLDSQNYRYRRLNSLLHYVCKTADKVVYKGHKIKLEPMSDVSRKFVHTVLELDDRVFARSEGHAGDRSIVIFSKRPSKPSID